MIRLTVKRVLGSAVEVEVFEYSSWVTALQDVGSEFIDASEKLRKRLSIQPWTYVLELTEVPDE